MKRAQRLRNGVVLATAILTLTGCATAVAGAPLRADAPAGGSSSAGSGTSGSGASDSGSGSTLPTLPPDSGVPDSAVGLKPDAPTPDLTVSGDAHTDADTLAEDSLADVEAFYQATFEKAFGTTFVPPGHYLSYDSNASSAAVCNHSLSGSVNASYVTPPCDTVIWDRRVLLPNMMKNIGVLAVPTTLAHEMGHRVQTILGFDDAKNSVLVAEQQADCYAGAYWRWVNDGNSKYFNFNQTAGMTQVLTTMMTIRDPLGTNPAEADGTGQGAHGDAFDRIYAFTLGFANGEATCNGIDQASVDARVSESPFSHIPNPKTADNLPITDDTLGDVTATVNSYFAGATPGYQPPTLVSSTKGAVPACDGKAAVSPVAYCPSTNTVSYDLTELQRIGTPTAGFSSFNGDFSAIILLVSRYALAAQAAGGASTTGVPAGLRAVCFAGSWASWMRQPQGAKKLSLSPADLDKATYELINSPAAAGDASGTSNATIFDRVQAFNIGVTHSIDTCTHQYAG
jgi:predicted metalloprotease